MSYYIGQALGLLASGCSLLIPLQKKKWQMLVLSAACNLLFALNMVLIGQIGSAVLIYLVALTQSLVSLRHVKSKQAVSVLENILFLILYVSCGLIGFRSALDLLPIVGSVFIMLATFQPDERKSRIYMLTNATLFFIYCLIVGSASMLAELMAMITTLIAMVKYRKKKQ